MKITTIFLTIGMVLVGFSGCNRARESSSDTGPSHTSLSGTPDRANTGTVNANGGFAGTNADAAQDQFWMAAGAGGMAEIEAGQVAAMKAENPEVKQFAQMMVADHTKSNEELKALAGKHNASLPTGPDGEHQAMIDRLKQMSGAEFDRAYVDAMVKDHEASVQLFEAHAASGSGPDTKAFAARTLPTLRQHLEMIRGIQAKMK